MDSPPDIQSAIDAAIDEQRLRSEALKLAIQAIRKMQYGPPGQKQTMKLAQAFYDFLKGGAK